ncbi:MAG: hypothetical protein QM647_13955 [Asticcacaulis sp.]
MSPVWRIDVRTGYWRRCPLVIFANGLTGFMGQQNAHRFATGRGPQALACAFRMGAHGAFGDIQRSGDFLGGEVFRCQAQNFFLSF